MKQHKKVTYTLDQRTIGIISRYSFLDDISKSKFVSICVQLSYEMMIDDDDDDDKEQFNGVKKKRKNTTPITFTLPIDVLRNLDWFSGKLDMKKSHLVSASILNYEQKESEKLSQKIDDLMRSSEQK